MTRLVVIADDFTGALDTGVQFAEYNASIQVLPGEAVTADDFEGNGETVLVIDAETRRLTWEQAYQVTRRLVEKATAANIPYIYIKTDSALRGNIGSALKATLDASGRDFLAFVPAFPAMNRITKDGVHFIGGVPVNESEFGRDPFESVRSPFVPDLFAGLDVPVRVFADGAACTAEDKGIGIFDAQSDAEMQSIAGRLHRQDRLHLAAGCAGFASMLPEYIGFAKKRERLPAVMSGDRILVVSGSLNDITRRQVEHGERMGYRRVVLTPPQRMEPDYLDKPEGAEWLNFLKSLLREPGSIMFDTGFSESQAVRRYMDTQGIDRESARITISQTLGIFLKRLLTLPEATGYMPLIIGGDTLFGFIEQLKAPCISPLCELVPGVVLFSIEIDGKTKCLLSKSGGFGDENLFEQVSAKIKLIQAGGNAYERIQA